MRGLARAWPRGAVRAATTRPAPELRLTLFRSLLDDDPAARLAKVPGAFDGVELRLAQLEALAPDLLRDLRVICRLEPADADDAGRQLDRLATCLASSKVCPELIVVAPEIMEDERLLEYLIDTLPVAAQFLEAHPAIGTATARLNVQGNPEPGHVGGVAHDLAGRGVERLDGVLDVLPPTRLALRAANVWAPSSSSASTAAPAICRGRSRYCDALDLVVDASDHVYVHTGDPPAGLAWEEVWSARQLGGARETFATCDEGLAQTLRASFERSRSWRAGAADRRAVEGAAWIDDLLKGPLLGGGSEALAAAVETFGLGSPGEAALLTPRGIRARWRVLALRAHPDTGGTAEAFRALGRHYRVLAAACGHDDGVPVRD